MVRPKNTRTRRAGIDYRALLRSGVVRLRPGERPPSMAVLRGAWSELGPELLAKADPGRRPWGFWAFDPQSPCRQKLSVLSTLAHRGEFFPMGDGTDAVELLAKHGLLRPGEREAAEANE